MSALRHAVTCRCAIVTDVALEVLGHQDLAAIVIEHGCEVSPGLHRAEFDSRGHADEFATRVARAFPEDEVTVWRLVKRVAATPSPGRRRDREPWVAA